MTATASLLSLLVLLLAARFIANDRQSAIGWAFVGVSVLPPLVLLTMAKAVFVWLALLGIAGFAVTIASGIRATD